jgi:hypothetical protein
LIASTAKKKKGNVQSGFEPCTPIPVLGRQRWEDLEFEAIANCRSTWAAQKSMSWAMCGGGSFAVLIFSGGSRNLEDSVSS